MGAPAKKTAMPTAYDRAIELISEAMNLPEAERPAFLESFVKQDSELARYVRELLPPESQVQRFWDFMEGAPNVGSAIPIAVPEGPPEFPLGAQLGEFRLMKLLGRGGFGTVYLAYQASLERHVALKITRMVGREARILAQLEHDNIVKVYSENRDQAASFWMICMQFVEGGTLADVMEELSKRPLEPTSGGAIIDVIRTLSVSSSRPGQSETEDSPLQRLDYQEAALWIGVRMASALDYAHQKGVLHLDVKPSNVLINRFGRPFLTDFNVSFDSTSFARGGGFNLGGTLTYMAPEQLDAFKKDGEAAALSKIDARSDLYSLGIVLRELLNRSRPVAGDTRRHTMMLKQAVPVEREEAPAGHWHHIDLGIRLVIARCTDPDPRRRYQSAANLAEALEGCMEMRQISKALPKPGWLMTAILRRPLPVSTMIPIPLALLAMLGATWFALGASALELGAVKLGAFGVGATLLHVSLALLWRRRMKAVKQYLATPMGALHHAKLGVTARAHTHDLPSYVRTQLAWLWLPAMIATLATFRFVVPVIDDYVFGRALFAFGLLGVTAAGAASLVVQVLSLRTIYPRLWLGEARIRGKAADELRSAAGEARVGYVLTAVPVVAAWALYFAGPPIFQPADATFLPWLGALTVAATAGVFATSHWMADFTFAFTGRTASGKASSH